MISRKRILYNSCRSISQCVTSDLFDEDIWFDLNSLVRDHVQEILDKYDQLDDEIWGKIICMERNRRIAKAYARSPVITIDNRCTGFNGDSIGLAGFENPYRDPEIMQVHRLIGDGVAVAADEDDMDLMLSGERSGKRSRDLIKSAGRQLFDMRMFVTNLNNELMSSSVRVQRLENGCFTAIAFSSKPNMDLIDTPVWIMIINVIAMEMLHRNLRLIGHLETLGCSDREDESPIVRRRSAEKKERKSCSGSSGTLMLGTRHHHNNNVLLSLRHIPTPDYDSPLTDEYREPGQKRLPHGARGILNSVLRRLPLHAPSRDPDNGYHKAWRRASGPLPDLDSDESCTHIYSSICDSSSSQGGKRTKKPRTTISKSLRFLMRRSK